MGRKRIILLSAVLAMALLVVAICLVIEPGGPPEPIYQGEPLTYWLRLRGLQPLGGPAWAATNAIGTNAIPTLLRELSAREDSSLKRVLRCALQEMPVLHYRYYNGWERNFSAVDGFRALGARASNAVPELIKIFDENISENSQQATAMSLGYIGPAAAPAVPSLLCGLTNEFPGIRSSCESALGAIHALPDQVIPAFIPLLHDADRDVRLEVVKALGKFGNAAKPAVPGLVEDLIDGNKAVREETEAALKVIDLEALGKARAEGKTWPR